MDISITGSSPAYNHPQTPLKLPEERVAVHRPNKQECAADQTKSATSADQLTKEDVEEMTKSLNDFMRMINTDIRFTLHEGTNRLMVQVIDMRNNEVIKEFPPRELLDTLAAISDYIGMLLDKRA